MLIFDTVIFILTFRKVFSDFHRPTGVSILRILLRDGKCACGLMYSPIFSPQDVFIFRMSTSCQTLEVLQH